MASSKKRQTTTKRGKPRQRSRGAPNTSDTADARWTVRGVPLNVREMAVSGAKERNMTVGDWLAEIIVLNRKNHTADDKTNLPTRPLPDLIELVDTMNERLTAMESERSQPLLKRLLGRRKAA